MDFDIIKNFNFLMPVLGLIPLKLTISNRVRFSPKLGKYVLDKEQNAKFYLTGPLIFLIFVSILFTFAISS